MVRFFRLRYQYVADVAERRGALRGAHLELAQRCEGLLVFRAESEAEVEQFAAADPYVTEKLVTAYDIAPWAVAAGAWADGKQ